MLNNHALFEHVSDLGWAEFSRELETCSRGTQFSFNLIAHTLHEDAQKYE
jgi:hypothetical protein